MKIKKLAHCFALISLFLSACTSDLGNITEETGKIVFKAEDFKYETQSRTSFDITDEGAKFTWSEKDTVGIFPDQGSQVYFSMAAGSGTNTASFDGGGWALKSSSTYTAYYPFKGDIYLDKTAIPVSYVGQRQVGNNSTEHLGAYDYMAAVASTPENGNVDFNFKHLGCLVQLNIPLEDACSLTSIVLRTEEDAFVTKCCLNLTTDSNSISIMERSSEFTIYLDNISFNDGNQTAIIYFMLPSLNLSGKDIITQIYLKNNPVSLVSSFAGKNFEQGKAYSITIPTPNYHPADIIDLGLSVKWASCNVGASSPEEYGDYYAFGEIEEKDYYSYETYQFFKYESGEWYESQNWIYIGFNISGTEYDVAHVKWGDKWRMPTRDELYELYHECTYKWVKVNGIWGGRFTSKKNGNSIFLPAAGSYYNSECKEQGVNGFYWCANNYNDNYTYQSPYLDFDNEDKYWGWDNGRYLGLSIRPVYD